jgi:hypothetical protein
VTSILLPPVLLAIRQSKALISLDFNDFAHWCSSLKKEGKCVS